MYNDLLKTGTGTLELTGANTYQGATIVHEGTLLVNGSPASPASPRSFLTDVHAGANLGGRGTVGALQIRSGGTVAPGVSAGTTSVLNTGNVQFDGAGARLQIEIGGPLTGGDGTSGYDRLNVTGTVSLAGAELSGSLLNLYAPTTADLFFIIVNDGTDAVQGTFAQGSSVALGDRLFEISYAGNFTGDPLTDSFLGGNDIVLRMIPEPSAAFLALAGAGLLIGRRRRQS
jgi:autotransporter-associated beta strand protein